MDYKLPEDFVERHKSIKDRIDIIIANAKNNSCNTSAIEISKLCQNKLDIAKNDMFTLKNDVESSSNAIKHHMKGANNQIETLRHYNNTLSKDYHNIKDNDSASELILKKKKTEYSHSNVLFYMYIIGILGIIILFTLQSQIIHNIHKLKYTFTS